MSFSGLLTVQRSGRVVIPRASVGALVIELPALGCRLFTHASRASNATTIVLPAALRALLALPCLISMTIASSDHAFAEPTLEPLGGTFEFIATPRMHRAAAHVTIPKAWSRTISDWPAVRVELDDHSAIVEMRSNVQEVFGVAIPARFVGVSRRIRLTRVAINIALEAPARDPALFDWASVTFDGLRVFEGEYMLLPTQRSQLKLLRRPPTAAMLWLLGFWLADGDKNALGFTATNKSRVTLGKMRDALIAIGASSSDLHLAIIHGVASRERAEAYYARLGIKLGALRHDPGHINAAGNNVQREYSGSLSLSGSSGFVALMRSAAAQLKPEAISSDARLAFLIGFLDGDGTVTLGKPPVLVASCATLPEAELVASLVDDYLGRESVSPLKERGGCYAVVRTLTSFAAARLIADGAFTANMSRPRLFHFAHRVLFPESITGLHRQWGFVDSHDRPSKQLLEARALLARHEPEWVYIQQRFPDEDSASPGVKGVLYEYTSTRGYTAVRKRQAIGDPSVHHPDEKRTQICDALGDRRDLLIYEAHAGIGGCTRAFAEHGRVISRTASDGQDIDLLRAQLTDPTCFDVVDLDPYGYPFNLLLEGALRLLKPDGILFLTCPDPAKNYRGGSKRIQAALFPDGPVPFDAPAVEQLVVRLALLRGLKLECVSRLDLPSVWRFAFQAAKL